MTRSVKCVGSDNNIVSDPAARCGTQPRTESDCNVMQCDPCEGNLCSNRGTCSNGVCTCDPGYQGPSCSTPLSCAGTLTRAGTCCTGFVTSDGQCCMGKVASDGRCCMGTVDVCGVCDGGATAVDVLGTCCAGAIGEDGLCCTSGSFDTCGVCDGDDSSCNVEIPLTLAAPAEGVDSFLASDSRKAEYVSAISGELVLTLGVPASSLRVQLSKDSASNLQATTQLNQAEVTAQSSSGKAVSVLEVLDLLHGTSRRRLLATTMHTRRYLSGSNHLATATVGDVQPAAVCGNNVCESGERCDDESCANVGGCKVDCPYTKKACPTPSWVDGGECAGHGICIGASGACVCFAAAGYVGSACEQCAAGWNLNATDHTCSQPACDGDCATCTTNRTYCTTCTNTMLEARGGACLEPLPTVHAPGTKTFDIKASISLGGYTTATFDSKARAGFRAGIANFAGVKTADVTINRVEAIGLSRRLASDLHMGKLRRLAGSGIIVDFTVTSTASADSAAVRLKLEAAQTEPSALLDAVKTNIRQAGGPEPDGGWSALTVRITVVAKASSGANAGIVAVAVVAGLLIGVSVVHALGKRRQTAPVAPARIETTKEDDIEKPPQMITTEKEAKELARLHTPDTGSAVRPLRVSPAASKEEVAHRLEFITSELISMVGMVDMSAEEESRRRSLELEADTLRHRFSSTSEMEDLLMKVRRENAIKRINTRMKQSAPADGDCGNGQSSHPGKKQSQNMAEHCEKLESEFDTKLKLAREHRENQALPAAIASTAADSGASESDDGSPDKVVDWSDSRWAAARNAEQGGPPQPDVHEL